jgi:hypothetical protein
MCAAQTDCAAETGERQAESNSGGKFSLESDFGIEARNSVEFSKPQIRRPDREFESRLVRQLVYRFCTKILLFGIRANYPGVSLRKLATTDSRGPNLGSPGAFSAQLSQVATSRFGPFESAHQSRWKALLGSRGT